MLTRYFSKFQLEMRLWLLIALQVLSNLAEVHWRRYRLAILVALILLLCSVVVDAFNRVGIITKHWLVLSRGNPWGIVTSMIVHGDFYHLYWNISSLMLVTIMTLGLFMLSNAFIDDSERASEVQVKAFILIVMLSHIIPSLRLYLEAVASGEEVVAYGLSQVVFGLLGLFSIAFTMLIPLAGLSTLERGARLPRFHRATFLASTTLFLAATAILALGLDKFLEFMGIGIPEVNVRGHLESFLLGLVAGSCVLAAGYRDLNFTLTKFRAPGKSLRIEEARRQVVIKSSRIP